MNENSIPRRIGWQASLEVYGATLVAVTFFALTPVATYVIASETGSVTAALLRIVLAAAIALAVLLRYRPKAPRGFRQIRYLVISAFGAFVGFPIFFSLGLERTSAVHAAVCMAPMGLVTGLIDLVIARTWPRWPWICGTGLAMTAVVTMESLRMPPLIGSPSRIGDILVLISVACAAGGFVAGGRLARSTGSWSGTFWSIAVAGIVLLPWLVQRVLTMPWPAVSPSGWLAVLLLAGGSTVVAYGALFHALARGGVALVAPVLFLQPVLALIFAAGLIDEPVTKGIAILTGTVLLGIALTRIDTARPYPMAANIWRAIARRIPRRSICLRDHMYFLALTRDEFERAARDVGLTRAELAAALSREDRPREGISPTIEAVMHRAPAI